MECYHATREHICVLSSILGMSIVCGVRNKKARIPEYVPTTPGYKYALQSADTSDKVKGLLSLPSDRNTTQPQKFKIRCSDVRVDLLYNPVLLIISV